MRYLILAAGSGTRLHPFTKDYPKCMFHIGKSQTVAQRMINLINKHDAQAKITLILGFHHEEISKAIKGCDVIINPFFAHTNSIASLWFAKDLLNDDVTIINGDIVMSDNMMKTVVQAKPKAAVFIDSSIKDGDYNVQVKDKNIVVMSKELKEYHAEYAGITKLDKKNAQTLKDKVNAMVNNGLYNEWYENALVHLIFDSDFELSYFDISDHEWIEIDTVNDLLKAKNIQQKENI